VASHRDWASTWVRGRKGKAGAAAGKKMATLSQAHSVSCSPGWAGETPPSAAPEVRGGRSHHAVGPDNLGGFGLGMTAGADGTVNEVRLGWTIALTSGAVVPDLVASATPSTSLCLPHCSGARMVSAHSPVRVVWPVWLLWQVVVATKTEAFRPVAAEKTAFPSWR
jgi:hypothetical protein